MKVFYNDKGDILYIRLNDKRQPVINRRIADNIVLDIGAKGRVIGIEIMDASRYVDLQSLFPIKYNIVSKINKGLVASKR